MLAAESPSPNNATTFFARRGLWILCAAGLLLPWGVWGASQAVSRFQNDVRLWLPKGFDEAQTYAWYSRRFGADELVVASWPGCTLQDPRLDQLASAILQPADGGETYFRRVVTGPELFQRLIAPPFELSAEAARARLRGTLVGTDGQTSALLAWGTEQASANRRGAVEHVRKTAAALGIGPHELHLGGPTVDSAAIDRESRNLLVQQTWLSVLILWAAAWWRLRKWWLVVSTIGIGMFAGALSLTLLYLSGGRMNLTLVMLPTLVFILTVSAAIHIVNYYAHAVEEGSHAPAERAVATGWYPCVLATLTSMIGLVSLTASQVVPIRQFGLYSGLGLLASLPLVLPALLEWWGRGARGFTRRTAGAVNQFPWLDALSHWIVLRHRGITLFFLAAMVAGSCGIPRLRSTVKIQNRFSARSQIIQDYRWLEAHLGPLVPLEVVVCFPPQDPRSAWERFEVVAQIEQAILESPDVLACFSATTFRPNLPRGRTARAVAQRSLMIDGWTAQRAQREQAGFVAIDPDTGQELWHLTARVYAINQIDYGRFVETLRHDVAAQLAARQVDAPPLVYTGGIPLIYKAQRQILRDLATSFAWAFAIISVVFMLALRSVLAGLVAMVPNLFPPAVVLGSMGWLGWTLDIGSVMTASVALGMAVDGTFHYLTWYRRQVVRGGSRRTATRSALRHCARALTDSTIICALGVLPYVVTNFLPTLRFALLLSILMVVALGGDLVLLPALLVGRLGTLFGGKKRGVSALRNGRGDRTPADIRISG